LWIHKGAVLDFAENICRGEENWRDSYSLQAEQKKDQIEEIIRFAESHHCRMTALVKHFGDTSDRGGGCGICDFCAPADTIAQKYRAPSRDERVAGERVLERLRSCSSRSTGKLHADLFPHNEMIRDDFEELLGAMARSDLLSLTDAVFEQQGKRIPYRSVSLLPAGRSYREGQEMGLHMREMAADAATAKKKSRKKVAAAKERHEAPPSDRQARLEQALRAWRLTEAKRRNMPAFRIFGDRTLRNIANSFPKTDSDLLAVPGIGMGTVEKYGAQIFRLVATAGD
jgi:superfamily II DNA helicase RecQ